MGTLYVVVQESTHADPSVAQVKAGQNGSGTSAAYSSSKTSSTSQAETFNATGLTNGTDYETFFVWTSPDTAVFTGSTFTTYTTVANVQADGAGTVTAQANAIRHVSPTMDGVSGVTGQVNATKVLSLQYDGASSVTAETDDTKVAIVQIDALSTVAAEVGTEKTVTVGITSASTTAIETDDIKAAVVGITSASTTAIETDDTKVAVVSIASVSTTSAEVRASGTVSVGIDSTSTMDVSLVATKNARTNINATSSVDVTLSPIGETLYVVVQDATEAAPSVAQVKGGLNGSGNLAAYKAYQSATTTDTYTFNAADLSTATDWESYFVWSDGTLDSDVLTGQTFTTYSTVSVGITSASTMTAALETGGIKPVSVAVASTSTATINTSGTFNVSPTVASVSAMSAVTDQAAGRLYVVVMPVGDIAPSAAQIQLGQNGSGAQATFSEDKGVDASGVFTFTATGLSEGTFYKSYFVFSDGVGESNVLYGGQFQTDGIKPVVAVIDAISTVAVVPSKSGTLEVSATIGSASTCGIEVVRYPKWWNDEWWPLPFWRQPFWGVYRRTTTDAVAIQAEGAVTIDPVAIKRPTVTIAATSVASIETADTKQVSVGITAASTVTSGIGRRVPIGATVDVVSASTVAIEVNAFFGAPVGIASASSVTVLARATKIVQPSISGVSTVSWRKTSIDNVLTSGESAVIINPRSIGTRTITAQISSEATIAIEARLLWQQITDSQNSWSEVDEGTNVWTGVSGDTTHWNEVN